MRPMHSRALALLLAMVMVLSMIPVTAFAEGNATTWTKVDFSAITAEDTVAITMTKDGTTYVLPTIANLFGLDADYGAMIGHDAFSADGGWAFWLDGCWFDGTQWSRQVREDIEQQKKMSQFILAGNYFAD